MERKSQYTCVICGKKVFLTREEKSQMDIVMCPDCYNDNSDTASYNTDRIRKAINIAENVISAVALEKAADDNEEESDMEEAGDSKAASVARKVIASIKNNPIVSNFERIEIDGRWEYIGNLYDAYMRNKLHKYSKQIGLYAHKINGEVKYIGRATEYNNGGLSKRLSDYCRLNGSARKHPSGQKIYENRRKIETFVLVVGNDEEAKQKTIELEKKYIKKYNPSWNEKLK